MQMQYGLQRAWHISLSDPVMYLWWSAILWKAQASAALHVNDTLARYDSAEVPGQPLAWKTLAGLVYSWYLPELINGAMAKKCCLLIRYPLTIHNRLLPFYSPFCGPSQSILFLTRYPGCSHIPRSSSDQEGLVALCPPSKPPCVLH